MCIPLQNDTRKKKRGRENQKRGSLLGSTGFLSSNMYMIMFGRVIPYSILEGKKGVFVAGKGRWREGGSMILLCSFPSVCVYFYKKIYGRSRKRGENEKMFLCWKYNVLSSNLYDSVWTGCFLYLILSKKNGVFGGVGRVREGGSMILPCPFPFPSVCTLQKIHGRRRREAGKSQKKWRKGRSFLSHIVC